MKKYIWLYYRWLLVTAFWLSGMLVATFGIMCIGVGWWQNVPLIGLLGVFVYCTLKCLAKIWNALKFVEGNWWDIWNAILFE